jgi:hypothetical protein
MFVARGQVVDDATTAAAGNISLAPVKIVGVVRKKVVLEPMLSFPKQNRSTTTLAAGTSAFLVEEGSGVVNNVLVNFA